MKNQTNQTDWIIRINNGLKNPQNYLKTDPLKFIGDEAMFFIEECDMGDENAASLFENLCSNAKEQDTDVPKVKIVAAYCENVLPLTFTEKVRDYFGLDIDRTARLKNAKPEEGEVIIDSRMHAKIHDQIIGSDATPFSDIGEKECLTEDKTKGINGGIEYYRWSAPSII